MSTQTQATHMASNIRADSNAGFGDPVGTIESAQIYFLAEIAAQIAELKEEVSRIADNIGLAIDSGDPRRRLR